MQIRTHALTHTHARTHMYAHIHAHTDTSTRKQTRIHPTHTHSLSYIQTHAGVQHPSRRTHASTHATHARTHATHTRNARTHTYILSILMSICLSVVARKPDVAILARSSREMSQTVRID